MGLFTSIKQRALGAGARIAFNHRFARYGTMPQLHLNLTDRHVEGDIVLKGETAPIHFAADYELQHDPTVLPGMEEPTGPIVTLSNVQLSREWMHQLAQDLVVGKPLPIPPDAAKWLGRLGVL